MRRRGSRLINFGRVFRRRMAFDVRQNMKRDMNLIRLLLLQQEEEEVDLSEFTEDQIVYHCALAIEANLLRGSVVKDHEGQPRGAAILGLTWDGHDFLDAARNESAWNQAKEVTRSKGLTLTFDILKDLLAATIRQQVGL